MNLSKNKIKYINSLKNKKYRDKNNCFIAEGDKLTSELLNSNLNLITIIATKKWLDSNTIPNQIELIEATDVELKKISNLTTPQNVMAIVEKPSMKINVSNLTQDLVLALDDIQDPGNLGTIIRLADWFGIKNIICSTNTVDVYNSKVVQATMGAICRVNLIKHHLPEFISSVLSENSNLPIYGTFLEGENVYEKELSREGIIIMGNEGKGISSEIEKLVTSKIKIPSFPIGEETSESLNVSIATSIICSEFRRRF